MNSSIQAIKQRFGLVGKSKLLDMALDTAIRVANTELTVLIFGESGVGKEAFSKIIHSLSNRKHNEFIAINCGAIPEGTINSELFGHEKGAFTGASNDRKGYFETVDGGTIFLDEIGEMPLDTQSFLLRILETGEFIRVGSSKVLKTNVRVIAATNVDLMNNIQKGKFREDLYYRLNTVPIRVPSLRERPEDISLLFRKFSYDFAEKYRTTPIILDDEAYILLENYTWPGNIRELKNVAEQLSVLSEDRNITADNLIDLIPNIVNRNLPSSYKNGDQNQPFQEREILYKLLFDMKSDLNDMKKLIFELVRANNLSMPEMLSLLPSNSLFNNESNQQFNQIRNSNDFHNISQNNKEYDSGYESFQNTRETEQKPLIIDKGQPSNLYKKAEIVEMNLSLEDMEKDFILKAIKKHGGKRKEAADELGISERTLYRKIKQYDIQV
ncbi:MAG: sigma-54-dependent Fis family transcriptional regulator [Saprospiraceae bacterium]|nr:sigma-54-dependent Fis family transcriptional regulator [Saprospiraceae bacterium]